MTAGAAETAGARTRVPPRWRTLLILFYAGIAAVIVAVTLVRVPAPEGGLALADAVFQPLGDFHQPADERAWSGAALPHSVPVPGAGQFWGGLYRFEFDWSGGGEPWSILIPGHVGRVQVEVNGTVLADSSLSHSSVALVMTWPEIVPIPAPVLREGVNRLEIRQEARVGLASYLSRVYLGPDRLLRPVYRQHHFPLITLPTLMVGWEFATALALLIVCAVRPAERAFFLFSLLLLGAVLFGLPLVAKDSLELEGAIRVIGSVGIAWQTTVMLLFALAFVGRRTPRALYGIFALPVVLTVAPFIVPPEAFRVLAWTIALPAVILEMAATLALFLEAAFRRGDTAAHIVSGGSILALGLTLRDVPIAVGAFDGDHLFLSRFGVPGLLAMISSVLMWRFAVALNVVDRFNSELRREIAIAEAALRKSLEREREHERASALEAERRRLTRDLHDGLAGQLVSMVALSSRDGTQPGAFGTAARRALADLRMVLASLAEVGDDLGMMLANFRYQVEPQLRALGVTLDWRMSELPEVSGWTSSAALELFRLLQEATINAARHSGADRVRIDIAPTEEGVRVVVADQGRGGAADRPGGHGLANMRRRARTIGGRLAIESGPSGTRVILDLNCAGFAGGPTS